MPVIALGGLTGGGGRIIGPKIAQKLKIDYQTIWYLKKLLYNHDTNYR